VDVADSDAAAVNLQQALGRNAHAVVVYFDGQAAVAMARPDMDLAT
jgi:hypothetical protein